MTRRARYQVASPVANPFTCRCQLACPHHKASECRDATLARRRDHTGEWADLCAACGRTHATVRQEAQPMSEEMDECGSRFTATERDARPVCRHCLIGLNLRTALGGVRCPACGLYHSTARCPEAAP